MLSYSGLCCHIVANKKSRLSAKQRICYIKQALFDDNSKHKWNQTKFQNVKQITLHVFGRLFVSSSQSYWLRFFSFLCLFFVCLYLSQKEMTNVCWHKTRNSEMCIDIEDRARLENLIKVILSEYSARKGVSWHRAVLALPCLALCINQCHMRVVFSSDWCELYANYPRQPFDHSHTQLSVWPIHTTCLITNLLL